MESGAPVMGGRIKHGRITGKDSDCEWEYEGYYDSEKNQPEGFGEKESKFPYKEADSDSSSEEAHTEILTGYFTRGRLHGYGKFRVIGGIAEYEGSWKDGERHGFGKEIDCNDG